MPEVRDIVVHVTTSAGVELPEWGVHSFRRNHKTSAYIQSTTDMPFRVSITPKIPYIAADVASAHVYETRRRGSDRPGFFQMEDEWEDMDGGTHYRPGEDNHGRHNSKRGASRLHSRFSSEYGAADRPIKREPRDMGASFSSPPPSRNFRRIPPPHFHFLASMYLDGRSKAERKLVVYLDPDDEDFNRPDGKVSFKTRWVEGKDGKLREHGWVFKDVGIETVFDKMLLSGDHQVSSKVHMRDEDSIIAAMNAADLGAEGDIEREERTKLGQIVVTIERIKLGQKWVDSRFRAKHKEGDVDDIQMDGANTDITHTAGFGRATALRSEAVRVVAYTPYIEGEGVYATFQFFYRSEEMLRKFNFPGFHQSQAIHRDRRYLNAKLATLTPLGISQPLRPKKASGKEKMIPFEEVIKEGTSPVKQPSDYQFGDEYRENDEKDEEIKKEESVCGLDDADPFSSPPYSTPRSGSRSPPKFSSKGKEKENLKPENNYKLTDVGQHDPHRTPLGNKNLTSTSQASKTASFTIPQPSDTAPSPSDYEPDSESQGPELNLLGDRAVSTISLPSTEGPPSTKSSEDGKPSLELYRKPLCESDADDEASDKETHHGSDEEAIDDSEKEPFGYDENDEQLQSAMRKIQLGKRTRNGDDDDGRTDNNRDELGLRSIPSAGQWMLQMRDPREAERERDIAKEMEALSQSTKNEQSAGPAKRRKGSEGQLVGMGGSPLDARTAEG